MSQLKRGDVGSPPPMRGKVGGDTFEAGNVRITPAYAGKRIRQYSVRGAAQDHPRLCGEKGIYNISWKDRKGSPPPMRGKAQNGSKRRCVHRITPAYAGKSITEIFQKDVNKDHPRLCGEKLMTETFSHSPLGSPPPMRGKD